MKQKNINNILNPSHFDRPAPFWSLNDKLNEKELRRQIREMAEKGWGSFIMHSRVGLVTEYLSEEWFSLICACCDEAKKNGIFAWLYDEDKWPSGFAGGLVPEKNADFRAQILVLRRPGEKTAVDITLQERKYCGISFEICSYLSPLDNPWFNGTCYTDLMNAEAVRYFLATTHELYKKYCGEYFGNIIPGIFTDEPCYIYRNLAWNMWIMVPWSSHLPDHFHSLNGYSIMPHLEKLFFNVDGYQKIRHDFYSSAVDLFKKSFTMQYHKWCTDNNLKLIGHFMSEDTLLFQTQWSGDVMAHYEYMDWPGIDLLGRTTKISGKFSHLVPVKQVSSAAVQLGKERALSEVFGCAGGQVSFFHRKWLADWQASLGIGFVNHHLTLYSMRGERKRDYPANFGYPQPWWEDEKEFGDYLGRLSAAVTAGTPHADILVLQPLSSVWCEYSPLTFTNDNYQLEHKYDAPFNQLSSLLMEKHFNFHYGNENLITSHGSVKGTLFTIGKCGYSAVVIPPAYTISKCSADLIEQFISKGGHCIFIKQFPLCIGGIQENRLFAGAHIAADIYAAIKMLEKKFHDRIRVTNLFSNKSASSVYVNTVHTKTSDYHFFSQTDENRTFPARIELGKYTDKPAAVCDLGTGGLYKLSDESTNINLEFAPAGSILIITGKDAEQARNRIPFYIQSGAYFRTDREIESAAVIENFSVKLLDYGVMLINDFSLHIGSSDTYTGPVCNSWHDIFYKLPDHTPFNAVYTFESEIYLENTYAVIECAYNLDAILFNGVPTAPMKKKNEDDVFDIAACWKDPNFIKVPLSAIQKGTNLLELRGKKINNITGPGSHRRVSDHLTHVPTEAEEVYLLGKFSLKEKEQGHFVIVPAHECNHRDITSSGQPFYAGRALFSADIVLPDKTGNYYLALPGAEIASAQIRVNDKYCGTVRWEPFQLDITRAVQCGTNHIEINAATTLVNLLGPNRRTGVKSETGIGPHSFTDMTRFQKKYELFPFGITRAVLCRENGSCSTWHKKK